MSDDSSSSDDSILNSPIVIKKNGHAKRSEKLKMDFLDECLNGTNARADVNRRIAVVESTVGGKPDENDTAKDTSMQSNHRETSNGETLQSHKSNGNEEDTTDNDDCTTTPHKRKPTIASSITQPAESDESYWARVEQFTVQNSTSSKHPYHSDRKRLAEGVDYDSEATNDEEWKDGGGMTRDQRRGEAVAKLTGRQSSLGLRRVFYKVKDTDTGTTGQQLRFYRFQSREEAIEDLISVVSKLKEFKKSESTSDRLVYQYFVRPLSILIKTSKNVWGRGFKSIYSFLDRNPVILGEEHVGISCDCDSRCVLMIPDSFIQWMWKMACSSLKATSLEVKCARLLIDFLKRESDTQEQNQCGFGIERENLKKYRMGDLASCLVNDFGLWMGLGCPPGESKNENGSQNSHDQDYSSDLDMNSLKRLFMLWSSLLQNDYVLMDETKCDSGVIGEGATRDLVALARVSLDPHLELASERYNTCGSNLLLESIQQLIVSTVDSATRQITNKFDQEHSNRWLENISIAIIESCSSFAAGNEGAADSDDKHGHLPLVAVVFNMQAHHDILVSELSYECALLRVHLAEKALKVCLTEICDWESQVDSLKKTRCNAWVQSDGTANTYLNALADHALIGFLTSEVAFRWIDGNKDDLLQNLPLFLAAIYIAGECVSASARIFFRSGDPSNLHEVENERFLWYSTEESDIIYETLSRIQDLSDSLRAECGRRSVISYPHLRRAKEHLTRLTKCIDGIKGRSSKEKKQRRRTQGSLDCFFRSSQDEFSPSPLE